MLDWLPVEARWIITGIVVGYCIRAVPIEQLREHWQLRREISEQEARWALPRSVDVYIDADREEP